MTTLEDTRKAGVPVIAIFMLITGWVMVVLISMGHIPRFTPQGKTDTVCKVLIASSLLQGFLGLFAIFSPGFSMGVTLAFAPMLAFWSFWNLEPAFLVLTTAVSILLVHHTEQLLDQYGIGCDPLFGDDHFCTNGWSSFLVLSTLLYQVLLYAQIFGSFYFFNVFKFVGQQPADAQAAAQDAAPVFDDDRAPVDSSLSARLLPRSY